MTISRPTIPILGAMRGQYCIVCRQRVTQISKGISHNNNICDHRYPGPPCDSHQGSPQWTISSSNITPKWFPLCVFVTRLILHHGVIHSASYLPPYHSAKNWELIVWSKLVLDTSQHSSRWQDTYDWVSHHLCLFPSHSRCLPSWSSAHLQYSVFVSSVFLLLPTHLLTVRLLMLNHPLR